MKKTILAVALTATLMSGCASIGQGENDGPVSYDELKVTGTELSERSNTENYEPSTVSEAEIIRTSVNLAFHAAKPAYERYTEEVLATPTLGNYFAATEAASTDEEKKAIYDALSDEDKKTVDNFMASSMFSDVMGGLKEAAGPAAKSAMTMMTIDSSELLKDVGFLNLINEKSKFSLTLDQVDYMNQTVVSAYKNYQVVSAFSDAQ